MNTLTASTTVQTDDSMMPWKSEMFQQVNEEVFVPLSPIWEGQISEAEAMQAVANIWESIKSNTAAIHMVVDPIDSTLTDEDIANGLANAARVTRMSLRAPKTKVDDAFVYGSVAESTQPVRKPYKRQRGV